MGIDLSGLNLKALLNLLASPILAALSGGNTSAKANKSTAGGSPSSGGSTFDPNMGAYQWGARSPASSSGTSLGGSGTFSSGRQVSTGSGSRGTVLPSGLLSQPVPGTGTKADWEARRLQRLGRSPASASSGSSISSLISRLMATDKAGQRKAKEMGEADRQMLMDALSGTGGAGGAGGSSISDATSDIYAKAEGLLNDMLGGGALGDDYWNSLQSRNIESIDAQTRGMAGQISNARKPGWQEALQRTYAGRQGDIATAGRDIGIARAESTQGQQKSAGDLATSLLGIKGAQTADDARLALSRTDLLRQVLGQYPYEATDYSQFYSAMGQLDPQALLSATVGGRSSSGKRASVVGERPTAAGLLSGRLGTSGSRSRRSGRVLSIA